MMALAEQPERLEAHVKWIAILVATWVPHPSGAVVRGAGPVLSERRESKEEGTLLSAAHCDNVQLVWQLKRFAACGFLISP